MSRSMAMAAHCWNWVPITMRSAPLRLSVNQGGDGHGNGQRMRMPLPQMSSTNFAM